MIADIGRLSEARIAQLWADQGSVGLSMPEYISLLTEVMEYRAERKHMVRDLGEKRHLVDERDLGKKRPARRGLSW